MSRVELRTCDNCGRACLTDDWHIDLDVYLTEPILGDPRQRKQLIATRFDACSRACAGPVLTRALTEAKAIL